MNVRLDLHILGWLLGLLGLFQLPALAAAWLLGEPSLPYALSAGVALGCGYALAAGTRTRDRRLRPRDGFLVVSCAWILASLFGALPFVLAGVLGPIDALFEAVAGFTTTGSSVMTRIAAAPRALLLWRAATQWVGGMGIILFTIAVLPLLGIGGMQLFKAEVPGPVADKVTPRVAETARRLWYIYVGFTAAEWLLLVAAGMSPFEALCHAFTTLATGGFSTRDASVGEYASPLIEWIVTLFMLVAGMNFVLHYRLLTGRFQEVRRDGELRYFLLVVAGAAAVIAAVLVGGGSGLEEATRLAAFQTVSIVTTTGFVSADFEAWPSLAQLVLLFLMVLGGMSGSTGGGVKSLRALLGIRSLRASFDRLVHPRAVRPVKYGGRPVPEEILAAIWTFFTAYFLLAATSTAVITAVGYDLVTAFSASLTALGNVGPGLGRVGAYDNFAHFPAVVKVVLSFCMIAGRLEIFTLLVLLSPSFWRR
jgi:trk system potassium uptake protein TrkH